MYIKGLFIFVVLPTFIAAFYFVFIASDKFVSEASFSVKNDKSESSSIGGIAGLVSGGGGEGNQSLIVKEFIESREFLSQLSRIIEIDKVYADKSTDPLARLSKDSSNEGLLDYMSKQILVKYKQDSGITKVQVESFKSKHSQIIAQRTIELAERFVNSMSERIRKDSINFANDEVEKAEKEVIAVTDKITDFRNRNQNIDPTQTSGGILGIVSSLETELSQKRTELDASLNYLSEDSLQIKSIKQKIEALEGQIEAQNSRLGGNTNKKLNSKTTQTELIKEYERLQLQKEFAIKRYELALSSLEQARMESSKKSVYLLLISPPNLPDTATKPKRMQEVLTVLVISFLLYSLLVLLLASIKDHAKPNYNKKKR